MVEYFQSQYSNFGYKMKDVYLYCGISKQAHSQSLKRFRQLKSKEQLYVGFIDEIRQFHPGMGLRLMYEQFHPEGIGRDAFIALGLLNGFRLRKYTNPIKTTRAVKSSRYPNLLVNNWVTNVNQVWVSDIFYFSIQGVHHYIVLIMDVYSRRIVGYQAADNMRAENNIKALRMALNLRGIDDYESKLIHHSDRGTQYISDDYTSLLDDFGIQISMCANVLENAHAERVNGTIKNDYLRRWNITDGKSLNSWLKKAVDAYNNRQHHSLKKRTPIEYEIYLKEQTTDKREKMRIYTIKREDYKNPNQLSLFPEYQTF